jgi:hypothetical protein
MKTRDLPLLVAFFLTFALPVRGQGTVTVTGTGNASSYGIYGPDSRIGKVSAGTFDGITDTQIMESANNADFLLQHWRPFTPWVGISDGFYYLDLPGFPPVPHTDFLTSASQVLADDSPFKGKAAYVFVLWPGTPAGPGPSRSSLVAIHKSTRVFPTDGSSATIDIAIDPTQPRLLAGRMVVESSYHIQTVTNTPGLSFLPAYDNWAFAWFGTTSTVPEALPEADPDGDGQTNAEEWKNATNPKDASSRLELHWAAPPSGSAITFDWASRPGVYYAIVQSDQPDIARPSDRPSDAVMAFDYQTTRTIPVPEGASRRFFSVFSWAP